MYQKRYYKGFPPAAILLVNRSHGIGNDTDHVVLALSDVL